MKKFDLVADLLFGIVVEVSGSTVRIELSGNVNELSRTHSGRVYKIGQLGSIVKIHFGRQLIFGFVTLLRMRSEEIVEGRLPIPPEADQRIMEIELFAEANWNASTGELKMTRGVTTFPLPRQGVYLLTRDELLEVYGAAERKLAADGYNSLVPFATYSGAEGVDCRANIDKMFGMHCAILGSTGSGKSGAVAAVLHSLLDHCTQQDKACHPRVVIIDPHGEYAHALNGRAVVYRAYDPIGNDGGADTPMSLPYWLMSADEFRTLVIGKTEREATSQNNILYKAITHARMVEAGLVDKAPEKYGEPVPGDGGEIDSERLVAGVTLEDLTEFDRDKPRPFRLQELFNHIKYRQAAREKKGSGTTEAVPAGEFTETFKSILDKLGVLRRDPRIHFLMKEWDPAEPSLAEIIGQLVGQYKTKDNKLLDIRIVDISGLPNEVAGPLTAMLARLLFQYKLYQTPTERERDPVLLVCEEAHRYVPDRGEAQYAAAQTSIRRIAREGRKYGLGLMLVSQRPADVESTVIAQCGTWIVLRLTNAADQQHVARFLPDGLSGMTKALPNLSQQEAIFVGEGAALPARIRIHDLPPEKLPKSETAKFAKGWTVERLSDKELKAVAGRMSGDGAKPPTTVKPST